MYPAYNEIRATSDLYDLIMEYYANSIFMYWYVCSKAKLITI